MALAMAGPGLAAPALGVTPALGDAPALSTAAGATVRIPRITHHRPRDSRQHADQTWSGYAVTGDTPYHRISGRWTIPALDCSQGGGDASPWIGIDGFGNQTVEQIGVDLDCVNGQGSYHPWVEMYPGPSDYFRDTIHAGDTMAASVSESAGVWTLTESDVNTGWSKTFTRQPRTAPRQASAEAVVEDVGGGAAPPVPDFGTVTFSHINVDGTALSGAGTVYQTTLQRGSTKLSQETALSGGGFAISWLHR
jgi:hypothetical protein